MAFVIGGTMGRLPSRRWGRESPAILGVLHSAEPTILEI